MDISAFYNGECFDAYNYLGCHLTESGAVFRTYAPNAEKISLIGDFSHWKEIPMKRLDGNFFECYVEGAAAWQRYKYKIYGRSGITADHCDPYGYGMEMRPDSASVIRDIHEYKFYDDEWMKNRSDMKDMPLNIYEIHPGSWKTPSEGKWYNYSDLADVLIPYVLDMGYNYIEMMPICEYPCDESWGYQATGFFAPSSRYGTVNELKSFVDKCHRNGIGVILDFAPVHFAVDGYALAWYDGGPLYEYPNNDIGYNEWGSKNFNHYKGEVRSFLRSAANYWISEYHFDGIRMDAISNIVYWQGRAERGTNEGGVEFLKGLNRGLKALHPDVILAAEDSTTYAKITAPVQYGGLGFDYKWNMGWMNDTLDYFRSNTDIRRRDYHKLTFSMLYYYSERYMLPLSHDEVVHGKATVLQKMNGEYEEKFPQAKVMYMYMYAHPGKKLNFMGNEIGQLREWDEKREQDWDILRYPSHIGFRDFMRTLNKIYLSHPALWEKDYDTAGFKWVECGAISQCLYAFERRSGEERILAVFNFSCMDIKEHTLYVDEGKSLTLLLSNSYEAADEVLAIEDGKAEISLESFGAKYYVIN